MRYRKTVVGTLILIILAIAPVQGTQETPQREFFIDPYTGLPNCIVVVGENAAVADVIAASWVATQIGSMAYFVEVSTQTESETVTFDRLSQLPNARETEESNGIRDFGSASVAPFSYMTLPHECGTTPIWDYDLYIDAFSSTLVPWLHDTGYAYESISMDFSVRDTDDGQTFCDMCSAATEQSIGAEGVLTLTQSYPALFPRHYWGTETKGNRHDPVGGIAYRSIVYRQSLQQALTYEGWSVDTRTCALSPVTSMTDPIRNPTTVSFMDGMLPLLEFGTDAEGYDYVLYGTVNESEVTLSVGDTYRSSTGAVVTVSAIDVYSGSLTLLVSSLYGIMTPVELVRGDTLMLTEALVPGINQALDCITVDALTIRSERTASLSIRSLSDYGAIRETIYGIDAPYVACQGLEWYLDIMPATEAPPHDKDTDPALFNEGNPSFSASDRLTIMQNGTCYPYLEVWLATPMEVVGVVDDTIMGCLATNDDEEVFSFIIQDSNHKDFFIDSVTLEKKTTVSASQNKTYVDIDTSSLAMTDGTITPEIKSDYNIIAIGGPVVNGIVRELVALGLTSDSIWETSSGEYLLYENVYVTGRDVLVVAGKDRESTTAAARSLLDAIARLG